MTDSPYTFVCKNGHTTVRNCHGPEIWRVVCDCGSPECPRKVEAMDVRFCFAHNAGVLVIRDGVEAGKS